MSKNGIKTGFLAMTLVMSLLSGCVKDVTVTLTTNKVVTAKVSFSKEVVPLFVANCATSGCHTANHTAPDLEKDAAYNSLKTLKMIDIQNPENSILYEKLTGKLVPAMPIGKQNNPSNINNLVLAWIKQGALNN
jgi:hypothetical protein